MTVDMAPAEEVARAAVQKRHDDLCGCGGSASSGDIEVGILAATAAAHVVEAQIRAQVLADATERLNELADKIARAAANRPMRSRDPLGGAEVADYVRACVADIAKAVAGGAS